ncbi:unnamed protein product, partial [Owenia fusiformis]
INMTTSGGLFLLFSFCLLPFCEASIVCKDKDGNPVDWFVVYKLPKIDSPNPLIDGGVGHFYMDTNNPTWTLSDVSLNKSADHAVFYTLQQIYMNREAGNVLYVMYNDEHPDGKKTGSYGHTKGDVMFDKETGFWLIHSVPKFPPASSDSYTWPDNALRYGQSMLCISLAYSQSTVVGKQLWHNQPYVYDGKIPMSWAEKNPHLYDIIHMKKSTPPAPYFSVEKLISLKNTQFISFAKHKKWDKELYGDLVAYYLNTSLNVETWQNGAGDLPIYCNITTKIQTIDDISMPHNITFSNHGDHSKWAASNTLKAPYTCIGDINRQISQFHRSGGTVCLSHKDVWTAFNSTIAKLDKCG